MKSILIISGPTASGKTKKAVQICKRENGEIISCDSRQIYKYLDIGSNKEGKISSCGLREIENIPQHLTDIIDPDKTYSAKDFACDAGLKIDEIISRGKLPVICGGTGLYIKALLYGLDKMPEANAFLRQELAKKNVDMLYEMLLSCDPQAAKKNKSNPQRLIRAIEVNTLTGKNMSHFFKAKKPKYKFVHYHLNIERKTLYETINSRCKKMIEIGMIEETQKVLDMGYAQNCPALSGIGYKHIIKFLHNEISKSVLLDEISKDTRHYAKRQITWFKSQKNLEIVKEGL